MADLEGRAWRVPPLRPKIFSISCSLSWNLAKSYVGAPPPRVGTPSYGKSWIRPWVGPFRIMWLRWDFMVEVSGKRQTTYITLFYDKYNHNSKEAKIEIILQTSSSLCNWLFLVFSLYIPSVLEWCQLSLINTAKVSNLFKELNRVLLVLHFLHYRSPLRRTSHC